MTKKEAAPWGEKHVAQAWRVLCDGLRCGEPADLLTTPLRLDMNDVATEEGFRRAWVRFVDIDGDEKAAKLVRDIAEGRKVRERGWRVDGRWLPKAETCQGGA